MNLKGAELDDNIFRNGKEIVAVSMSSSSTELILLPFRPDFGGWWIQMDKVQRCRVRRGTSLSLSLSLLVLCRSSAHVRRLLGDAGVAVVRGARVHHVAMMIGLHRLLRISLASHHAHLHLHGVLGWLVHVRRVTVVPAVHHGLWHSVASRHGSIERIHVHGVVSARGRHEVRHHATLHR